MVNLEAPQYGFVHPRKDHSNNAVYEDEFVFKGDLVWKCKIGKPLFGSPLPVEKALLIGAPNRRIYSIDVESGRIIRKHWVDIAIKQELYYEKGILYFTGDDDWNKLIAIDTENGRRLWDKSAGASLRSPLKYRDKLFFTTKSGKLFCLQPEDGDKLWDFNLKDIPNTLPLFWNENIFISNMRGDLFLLNTSGEVLLKVPGTGSISADPVRYSGTIFIPYMDGNLIWYADSSLEILGQIYLETEFLHSPLITRDFIYILSKSGIFFAIDYHNGTVLWENDLGEVIISSPILAGDYLVCTSLGGTLYLLRKDNGQVEHKVELVGMISSNPVYYQGRLFLASEDGYLYALE
ncbi:PQQ-binding-like beta-propeller repeat protein [bacterium]|nr:PQQ-binding-like beta-propeller repeat protein [bacterium]